MKVSHNLFAVLITVISFTLSANCQNAEQVKPAINTQPSSDAKARSDADQEKKSAEWAGSLNLNDPAKEQRLKIVIAIHLKAIRDWHNEHP